MNEWISVLQQLPPFKKGKKCTETVIVCDVNSEKKTVTVASWCFGMGWGSKKVTHWMPKPEPPK